MIAVALGGALLPAMTWLHAGRCFLGLLILYLAWTWVRLREAEKMKIDSADDRAALERRLVVAVLAAALMARMVLNGRVHQFGYYQAALAAVVILAVLWSEFPRRFAATRFARGWARAAVLATLVPAVVSVSQLSRVNYRQLNTPMGVGRDQFYTYAVVEPIARLAGQLTTVPRGASLLVLPEGLMLNYLARLRSPVAPFFFYSAATEGGREARLVQQLTANPPDFVMTLPRDLSEYGIRHYGERPGAGQELMRWVAANYEGAPGDSTPIVYRTDAIQVFRRRTAAGSRP